MCRIVTSLSLSRNERKVPLSGDDFSSVSFSHMSPPKIALTLLVLSVVAVINAQLWFEQRLNHFNPQDTRTWKQQYFVNDTWWNPSLPGPIFVNIGGEGPESSYDVTTFQESNYAQRFGAILFGLEHRFYGLSQPTGDLEVSSLQYLSSQQALADLANFILSMKDQYEVPNATVIVFGCSYSGALASWFRMKYPHIARGVVAGSAPVLAVTDFFQYLDVVDQSLSFFTGSQCDAIIQNATAQIQAMINPQNIAQLNTLFNICTPLDPNNWLDVATFMSTLMGNFMDVVQYNDDNRRVKPPVDASVLCDWMIAGASDPLATYVNISNFFQNGSCLDASYADQLTDLKNTTVPGDSSRQWVYQTCMEFGYFQTTDSPNQPFGNLVPLKYYEQMCYDAFGITFDPTRIDLTNRYYGGQNITPTGPTNVLFVNGHVDPWHALSITENLSDSVRAILIEQTAHCAHEYPSSPNDVPQLVAARQQIEAQIAEWLAL